MGENSKAWITPTLITIAITINSITLAVVADMNGKMFTHLTNEEIHCPRTAMVQRAEFDLLTKIRDKQIEEIKGMMKDELGQLRIEIRNSKIYEEKWKK